MSKWSNIWKITLHLSDIGYVDCILTSEGDDKTPIYGTEFNMRVSDDVDFDVDIRIVISIQNGKSFISMYGKSEDVVFVSTNEHLSSSDNIVSIQEDSEKVWEVLKKKMLGEG